MTTYYKEAFGIVSFDRNLPSTPTPSAGILTTIYGGQQTGKQSGARRRFPRRRHRPHLNNKKPLELHAAVSPPAVAPRPGRLRAVDGWLLNRRVLRRPIP
jgi:hypothetical protein